jgi:hypothetical protein
MSIRSSLVSLLALLSCCALACCGVPKGLEQGTVAIDLAGADSTVNLHSLDHGSIEQVTLKAGETRVLQLSAGVYSVELVPDPVVEPGAEPAGVGQGTIVVASGRVTTLRLAVEIDSAREGLVAVGEL